MSDLATVSDASDAAPGALALSASLGWAELLQPLLQALHWHGDQRQLNEAMNTSNPTAMDMQEFRAVLAHMGFASMVRHASPHMLDERLLPAVLLQEDGLSPAELLTKPEQKLVMPKHGADMLMFERITAPGPEVSGSLRTILRRFHPILKQVMLLSLLIGGLALAPTFYNMAIYDHVIASGSPQGLTMLITGVMLALAAEIVLRHLRAARLGYFGARIDHFVSCSVFEHLLYLPPIYTERASVPAQLARLRDFESVREFFTGPLATLFFEMPLVLIYLVAMVIVGGWLALVPAVLLLAYALLLWIMQPRLKTASRKAANAGSKKHEFLLETVSKLRAIRLAGMEAVWQRRFRQLSADASLASFHASYQA